MVRKTTYTPEHIDIIGELGDAGEGMAEAIVACGCGKQTFYDWQRVNPEFAEAVQAMRLRSQAFWERMGRVATFGGVEGFNSTSFIYNMKNRFPDDWRDKQEIEQKNFNVTISGDDADL